MNSSNKENEMTQLDVPRCKEHPQRLISCLYQKQKCPYKSRLACYKCLRDYKTMEGFEDVLDVLQDPTLILNNKDRPQGSYDELIQYFNLLEQNPEEAIHSLKEDFLKQIQQLEVDLKEGLEKYKIFRDEIAKAKQQFYEVFNQSNKALGYEQFKQAFEDILKVENYHQSAEWSKFEEQVNRYLCQFIFQDNQELNEIHYKLQQMEQTFFKPKLLSDFKSNLTKNVEQMCRKLRLFPRHSSLCDPLYFSELIDRIYSKSNEQPNVKLIFKGSSDGMNAKAFWGKCGNQGRTIIFCKSKSGHVFGGYTPCKWVNNLDYQKDASKSSFLFSYTRNEIYPILAEQKAIYGDSDYGPTFGSECVFRIGNDFQSGESILSGKDYFNESCLIENKTTHLMGGDTPNLIEMEVFQLQ